VLDPGAATARVRVVEDDEAIADVLRRSLRAEGHEVRSAGDGVEALTEAEQFVPDLVVLDLGLPRLDGVEVCRRLRADSDVPILILTARSETEDRVSGLDSGADDYLVKPFERQELLARTRALLRRRPQERPAVLRAGDVELDPAAHTVTRDGRDVELTAREFALLRFLLEHQNEVLTRTRLLEHVWDENYDGTGNLVDVYIGYLRKKLEKPFGRGLIRTVRGTGYTLDPQ